jgi:hypothetical protein
MFVHYTALPSRETRRMLWLGAPTFVALALALIVMSAPWGFVVSFVGMWMYTFVYCCAYAAVSSQRGSHPGRGFYAGAVMVQLVAIAAIVLGVLVFR